MLAVVDYLRHQQRPVASDRFVFVSLEVCKLAYSWQPLFEKHCVLVPVTLVGQCVTQTSGWS